MVHTPWRHGDHVNYNGEFFKLAVAKPGHMLEHPRIRRYSWSFVTAVTIRSVRTISRKPPKGGILRDCTLGTQLHRGG